MTLTNNGLLAPTTNVTLRPHRKHYPGVAHPGLGAPRGRFAGVNSTGVVRATPDSQTGTQTQKSSETADINQKHESPDALSADVCWRP